MLRRSSLLIAAVVAASATTASTAAAAERWAADGASGTETLCTSAQPCTLANAVSGAVAGDRVIVKAGTYTITSSLLVAGSFEVRGEDPANPPVLAGTSALAATTVSADLGARLTGLKITSNGGDALTLKGAARGDRLILRSETADAAKVVAGLGTTRLTNSLATSGGASAIKLREANGDIGASELRNVTVYATATGATAIRCETSTSTSALVNSIVRGAIADFDVSVANAKCSATNSNLRPSTGLTTIDVQSAAPTLGADYKPLDGSNTIDAGVDSALNGTLDLASATRVRGVRTDIGAYEFQADAPALDAGSGTTATTTPTTTPMTLAPTLAPTTAPTTEPTTTSDPVGSDDPDTSTLAPAAPPELGKSVLLDQSGTGTVLVKLPGTKRFVALTAAANLPVGTLIDSRKGAVTLSSALPGSRTQTGRFSDGLFEVRQSKSAKGMTDIHLRGTYTRKCPRKTVARAAAKRRKKTSARRLWASDKGGRFRTHGANSVATVRGTKWLTEDRCDGTYTKVAEGAVDVRAKHGGKTRRVTAGRSVLIRR